MENTSSPLSVSRDRIRPVPPRKLAVDVTIGDLFVVVYLALAVVFLARHWAAPAEEEFDDEAPEQRDRPLVRAAGG
jgi:hypothetical protein